jgi:hypothetical protein
MAHQKPRNQDAFKIQSGSSTEVEESCWDAALLRRKQQVHDFCPARKVDGFSDAEKNAEAD